MGFNNYHYTQRHAMASIEDASMSHLDEACRSASESARNQPVN